MFHIFTFFVQIHALHNKNIKFFSKTSFQKAFISFMKMALPFLYTSKLLRLFFRLLAFRILFFPSIQFISNTLIILIISTSEPITIHYIMTLVFFFFTINLRHLFTTITLNNAESASNASSYFF